MDGVWHSKVHLTVVFKCLIDVFQTRRALNVLRNREAKAHGFSILDIGVLSDDHYFELTEWDMLERIKYQIFGREYGLRLVLTLNELEGLPECRLLKVVTQGPLPVAQF